MGLFTSGCDEKEKWFWVEEEEEVEEDKEEEEEVKEEGEEHGQDGSWSC